MNFFVRQNGDPMICKCMFDVLRKLPDDKLLMHTQSLVTLAQNRDAEVRQHGADLIGKLGPKAANISGENLILHLGLIRNISTISIHCREGRLAITLSDLKGFILPQ